jgi:hypothetical protein
MREVYDVWGWQTLILTTSFRKHGEGIQHPIHQSLRPEAPTALHASFEACLDVTFQLRSLRINDLIGLGPAVRKSERNTSTMASSIVCTNFLKWISSPSFQHSRSLGDLPV